MAWSTDFLETIGAEAVAPRFVLRSVQLGVAWEQPFTWSSHPVSGADDVLDADQLRVQWGSLSPLLWRMSYSSLSVGILPGVDLAGIMRGQVVELLVGFAGQSLPSYERVWLGVLAQISMDGARRWTVSCVGLEGRLSSRWWHPPGVTPEDDPSLMPYAGTTTTLDADYTAGDATVTVVDTDGASKPAAGVYAFRITPTSGDPFVLTATGTTATTFTGCSSTAALDGTAVDAVAGDTVTIMALDEAHPIEIFGNIVSAAGVSDTYPVLWSLGLSSAMLDTDDMVAQKAAAQLGLTFSSPAWFLAEDRPVSDGTGWLHAMLGDAACFATQRQGQLTARAVVDADDLEVVAHAGARGIVSLSYQAFGGDAEYAGVTVRDRGARPASAAATEASPLASSVWAWTYEQLGLLAPSSATEASDLTQYGALGNEPPRSSPGRGYYQRALPAYGLVADRSDWRVSVALRTLPYATRVPEIVTVTTRGWGWAHVCAGDGVTLAPDPLVLTSRRGADDPLTTGARPWLVLGGGPDWPHPTCTYTLLGLPPSDTE